MNLVASNIDELYLSVCQTLLSVPRIGECHEITNAKLTLTDIDNNIVSIRNISKEYLMAELVWYFAGRNDVEFIGSFAKMWKEISDDGQTNNSAYGYLMRYQHGFDQIEKIIELLKKDPDSRRAVINLNVPNQFVIETKDEPCTIALQFMIRRDELCCTAMMRSNDIWFGFPYDVAFFTELQKYIAFRLEIPVGSYTHFAVSLHMYERDFEKIRKVVIEKKSDPVRFDRIAFYDYYDAISEAMDLIIAQKEDVKKAFKTLIRGYGIMEG